MTPEEAAYHVAGARARAEGVDSDGNLHVSRLFLAMLQAALPAMPVGEHSHSEFEELAARLDDLEQRVNLLTVKAPKEPPTADTGEASQDAQPQGESMLQPVTAEAPAEGQNA